MTPVVVIAGHRVPAELVDRISTIYGGVSRYDLEDLFRDLSTQPASDMEAAVLDLTSSATSRIPVLPPREHPTPLPTGKLLRRLRKRRR